LLDIFICMFLGCDGVSSLDVVETLAPLSSAVVHW